MSDKPDDAPGKSDNIMSIAGHEFVVTVRSVRELIDNVVPFSNLDKQRRQGTSVPPDMLASVVTAWLDDQLTTPVLLNDRAPDTQHAASTQPTRPRYAVINGAYLLTASDRWFSGRLSVPALWFPAGCVAQSLEGYWAPAGRELPLTSMPWLTDTGRDLIERKAVLVTGVGTLPVEAEEKVIIEINRPRSPSRRDRARIRRS